MILFFLNNMKKENAGFLPEQGCEESIETLIDRNFIFWKGQWLVLAKIILSPSFLYQVVPEYIIVNLFLNLINYSLYNIHAQLSSVIRVEEKVFFR